MTPQRKSALWKQIIQIIVTAVVSLTTALTATSCMQVNKSTDETTEKPVVVTNKQNEY